MGALRVVVCAANRGVDLRGRPFLITGPRHCDDVMRDYLKSLERFHAWDFRSSRSAMEEGFIDQFGVFMTREEAWVVAEAAGQLRYRIPSDTKYDGTHILWSENLY